jgi:hypothetical protein
MVDDDHQSLGILLEGWDDDDDDRDDEESLVRWFVFDSIPSCSAQVL